MYRAGIDYHKRYSICVHRCGSVANDPSCVKRQASGRWIPASAGMTRRDCRAALAMTESNRRSSASIGG